MEIPDENIDVEGNITQEITVNYLFYISRLNPSLLAAFASANT